MAPQSGLGAMLTGIAAAFGNGVSAQVRQWRLKKAVRAEVLLALLAARLSAMAYIDKRDGLHAALQSPELDVPGGLELLYFSKQTSGSMHPQWYLARGAPPTWLQTPCDEEVRGDTKRTALYLVFRGTWSKLDLVRDLCVEPATHKGRWFHGGFLSGVRDDRALHTQLRHALASRCDELYVVGHSLGGSLAMTLVCAELLPSSYVGPVTTVGVGSPPVLLANGDVKGGVQGGEEPSNHASDAGAGGGSGEHGPTGDAVHKSTGEEGEGSVNDASDEAPDAGTSAGTWTRPTHHLLVVNDCDVVPRMLGSPMPVGTLAMLAAMPKGGVIPSAVMRRNAELMKTMQQYSHPPHTAALLLRDGQARRFHNP